MARNMASDDPEGAFERLTQLQTIWEDNLQCAICLDAYKEPVALECLHSFCKPCLVLMVKTLNTKQIYCPTCRKLTLVYRGGIDGLPRNWFLDDIAEKVKRTQELLLTCPFQVVASDGLSYGGGDSHKISTIRRIIPCKEHEDDSYSALVCQKCVSDMCGIVQQTSNDLSVLDRPNRTRVSIKTYISKKFPGVAKVMGLLGTDIPVLPDLEARFIIPAHQRVSRPGKDSHGKRRPTPIRTSKRSRRVNFSLRSDSPNGYWAALSSDSEDLDMNYITPASTLTRETQEHRQPSDDTVDEVRREFDMMLNNEISWPDTYTGTYDWPAELLDVLGNNTDSDVVSRRSRAAARRRLITEELIRAETDIRVRRLEGNDITQQIDAADTPSVRARSQPDISMTIPEPPPIENLIAATTPQRIISQVSPHTFIIRSPAEPLSTNQDSATPMTDVLSSLARAPAAVVSTTSAASSSVEPTTSQSLQSHQSQQSADQGRAAEASASVANLFRARGAEGSRDEGDPQDEVKKTSKQRLRRAAYRRSPERSAAEKKSSDAQTENVKPKRVKKLRWWWRRLHSSEHDHNSDSDRENSQVRGACAATSSISGVEEAGCSSRHDRMTRSERRKKEKETTKLTEATSSRETDKSSSTSARIEKD